MADTLDKMLEPGERVVQRWRGGWLPDVWPLLAVVLGPLLAYPVIMLALEGPAAVSIIYTAGLFPGIAYTLYLSFQARRTRVVLTDRRLLYQDVFRFMNAKALVLAEIEALGWLSGSCCGALRVAGAGDQVSIIPLRRWNTTLPAALAEATGLPTPAVIGLARMAGVSLIFLCCWVAGLLLAVLAMAEAMSWLDIKTLIPQLLRLEVGLAMGLGILVLFPAAIVACLVLTAGAALVLARLILRAEDFALWLGSKPYPGWSQPLPASAVPAALKLGGLLYGRSLPAPSFASPAAPVQETLAEGEAIAVKIRRGFPPWGSRQLEGILTISCITVFVLYFVQVTLRDQPLTESGQSFDLGWWIGAILFFVLVVPFVIQAWVYGPGSLIVTNRRVIYRSGRRSKAVREEIALGDITAVRVLLSGNVQIARRDGPPLVTEELPRGQRIAVAVARAAGLMPDLVPRGVRLAERLWLPFGQVIALGGVVLALPVLRHALDQSWGIAAIAVCAAVAPFWYLGSPTLGLALILAVSRPFVAPEDLAAWLDRDDSTAGVWLGRIEPLFGPLVRWLTRRSSLPGGGLGHG